MKVLNFLTGALFLLPTLTSQAQPDTAKISRNALHFADSLVKTDTYGQWSAYADLAPLSVIKYYGGKEGYLGHVQMMRAYTTSNIEEAAPELKMETLVTLKDQWQCVVELSRYFHRDDKKYHLVSHLIGQSKDEGATWRFFDVNYNKVSDMMNIFPDILDMPIKETSMLADK
ncbi:hypothetical protein [Puia dinghuensis]|uniref:SnoaL-like domain-containing protein n=1 Tax=Puia dinghuensis TaxID=1792502 RepID=A0A8J2UG39_9BACT|nr:hypothetical protein [Puia dinghuensis]GGB13094.1 hypothetical protein GCM10011511_40920 [Puia dinghuensis]